MRSLVKRVVVRRMVKSLAMRRLAAMIHRCDRAVRMRKLMTDGRMKGGYCLPTSGAIAGVDGVPLLGGVGRRCSCLCFYFSH